MVLQTQTVGIALNSRYTAGAIRYANRIISNDTNNLYAFCINFRPDPREFDTLLSELSLCSSRTELYFRFVIKKSAVS